MSNIKKIVTYFFDHQFSKEMVDKVHSRLVDSSEDEEKEDALLDIWEKIGCPENNLQAKQAFLKMERKLGFSSRIPAWVRMVAIWMIPIVSVLSSYYMFREATAYKEALSKDAVTLVEHYVPAGKREQLVLPDGSKVWLNSGTILIYPTEFSRKNREVYLAGEGYFNVNKQQGHPFIVKTRALQVQVLGTKFNLSAYPEATRIVTTLEQGTVSVKLNNADSVSYLLQPDDQLIYTQETGKVEKKIVTATDFSDWKEGGLLFSNSPFVDIIKTLEQAYNVNINLQTSVYYTNRLTIHFNKNESLENVMMLMKEMIPGLEYRIEGSIVYIK